VRYRGDMSHAAQPSDPHRSRAPEGPRIEIHLPAGRTVTPERPLVVLVAEDSPIVSQRLMALIESLGRPIRAVIAATGDGAARLFRELRPDVAVLDIALPGVNGFDLLTTFKLLQPTCVFVMLTTYASPEFRENAGLLGADFFFSKTREFERVVDVLLSLTAPSPRP
jgi:DNA-binding NarL/FixJ family response regulator